MRVHYREMVSKEDTNEKAERVGDGRRRGGDISLRVHLRHVFFYLLPFVFIYLFIFVAFGFNWLPSKYSTSFCFY